MTSAPIINPTQHLAQALRVLADEIEKSGITTEGLFLTSIHELITHPEYSPRPGPKTYHGLLSNGLT